MAIDGNTLSRRMISGVRVTSGAPEACVAAIDDDVAQGRVRLGFVNTFTAHLLARSTYYRARVRNFMLLNDGVGLDIVSLVKHGSRFRFNLNGTDFVPFYLRATRYSYRIYLLGGRPGVAEQAAAVLREMAPQHDYVGAHDGYFDAAQSEAVVGEIRQGGANLVLVALGNLRQEMSIAYNLEKTGARLAIGVGALLDFLTEAVPRAPAWMRRLKLEWLYRLSREPKRLWKRYMVFTPLLIGHALAEKVRLL